MASKRDVRNILPVEGGAAPAPVKRHRSTRSKAASAQPSEPGSSESVTAEPRFESAGSAQTKVSLDPVSEREEIARLAYALWEQRGGHGGSAEEDWLRAEEDYRNRSLARTS